MCDLKQKEKQPTRQLEGLLALEGFLKASSFFPDDTAIRFFASVGRLLSAGETMATKANEKPKTKRKHSQQCIRGSTRAMLN
jgi:hypothetical protein